MKKVLLYGFICGALAMIVFHEGTQLVLYHQFQLLRALGVPEAFRPPSPGFSLRPVPPYGVPDLLSLAFWGGVGGVVLAGLTRWARMPDLTTGLLLGAVGVTVLELTVFAQARGAPIWAGNGITWTRMALLNGLYGWGAAFLMRPFSMRRGS